VLPVHAVHDGLDVHAVNVVKVICRSGGRCRIPSKTRTTSASLELLQSVERDGGQSQRRLAAELGIALGLVNAYLKRCIKKGLVKVSAAPARRYAYYLTPHGFAEKSRLTVEYLGCVQVRVGTAGDRMAAAGGGIIVFRDRKLAGLIDGPFGQVFDILPLDGVRTDAAGPPGPVGPRNSTSCSSAMSARCFSRLRSLGA
jgi:DNA-binding MarR family transcriptional regulator